MGKWPSSDAKEKIFRESEDWLERMQRRKVKKK